jgi:hypothetical protein
MVVVMVMSRMMMMVVVVMSRVMMVVVVVMSPMVVVMMVMMSPMHELHFRLLRPRGIIGPECLSGIGNRVQKFGVGTRAQRIDGACINRHGRFSDLGGQQRGARSQEAGNLLVHLLFSPLRRQF